MVFLSPVHTMYCCRVQKNQRGASIEVMLVKWPLPIFGNNGPFRSLAMVSMISRKVSVSPPERVNPGAARKVSLPHQPDHGYPAMIRVSPSLLRINCPAEFLRQFSKLFL